MVFKTALTHAQYSRKGTGQIRYGCSGKTRVESFFVNEFDMNFTGVGAMDFVEELYDQCKAANLLVSAENVSTVPSSIAPEICAEARSLISDSKLDKAFQLLLPRDGKAIAPQAFPMRLFCCPAAGNN